MNHFQRRDFLKTTLGAGIAGMPLIFKGSLFAQNSPNKRIQVAQIGCGRMGTSDMENVLKQPMARIIAICELDTKRAAIAKTAIEQFYQEKGENSVDVKIHSDYREVLARQDIDAVVISVPDHWHALVAIEAAIAGKHIYVQKPITYNIAESIALRTAVRSKKVILQTGSQQRSSDPWSSFRTASEAVKNGRLGQLKTIKIGVGLDKPSGKMPAAMSVPTNLNFDRWLGPAPQQEYMEGRVHPQEIVTGRPGWITTEDFGLGMITNWGAHHIDIAQWAMGQELGGPSTIDSQAAFMMDDVWTVHHTYHVEMLYPNNVKVILDDKFETGILFEGDEGTLFCTRGSKSVTASDPNAKSSDKKSLRASNPKILSPLTAAETKRWQESPDHHANWLEAIIANRDPIAPVDQAARSLQTCAAAWIGMKLKRKLTWDVTKEAFINDDEANAMRDRKPRSADYDFNAVMKKAGI
ncbi:MAG: Gfo/Idh/MocA family oxidoreductase [Gloeobacteraceae cyanobacterium ES-bin-144]|nr:Gfo/Idh/MocA family oxidoreductase [Verrucomicrobiales bacterium]